MPRLMHGLIYMSVAYTGHYDCLSCTDLNKKVILSNYILLVS